MEANPVPHDGDKGFLSTLDRLDKRLSDPIFRLQLPPLLEYLLSIPGNGFGLAVVALGVLPSWTIILMMLTSSFDDDMVLPATLLWLGLVGVLTLAVLGSWIALMRGIRSTTKLFYSSTAGIVAPLIGVALLSSCPWEEASKVGFFQISCWCVGVIPIAVLKPLVGRTRPCSSGIVTEEKHLQILVKIFRHDATQSFPSGDVAGAVSLVYPLWRHNYPILSVSCVLLSCFGRMYWQAHHLGDVASAVILPIPFLILLENLLGGCQALWWQSLAVYLSLVVTVLSARAAMKRKMFEGGTIPQKKH